LTTNYDEYLTNLINSNKKGGNKNDQRIAKDIFHSRNNPILEKNFLPIYHVHGFIPTPETIIRIKPENVVLAQDEYFQNMFEPYSWQTTCQLHYLMNYTCIFIGASLSDWNVLRLISNANKYTDSNERYVFINDYYDSIKYFFNSEDSVIDKGDKLDSGDLELFNELMTKTRSTIFNSFNIKTINYGKDHNNVNIFINDMFNEINKKGE
ncbi:MAG: SIR2 family protein, partial [Spirochaetes bacterium]|nr:SIR2 family protein [Spirochaetota bacterium]